MKLIARNRKANFNFRILDKKEAGVALRGWQVKSIKSGNVSLNQAYCFIRQGELYLRGANIGEWQGMGEFEKQRKDEDIKLLLRKEEIERWDGQIKQQKATTIVPLALFLQRGLIKCELGLAKGAKEFDKREKKKERDQERDLQRELKGSKYF
ncbi:MAG: SsrA-binding protein SmpB [Candidatus Dojkabacteria bacterium]